MKNLARLSTLTKEAGRQGLCWQARHGWIMGLIVLLLTATNLPMASAMIKVTPAPIASIPVEHPTWIAVNPTTNRIYVTGGSAGSTPFTNTVTVIDGNNQSVVATIPVKDAGAQLERLVVNPITNRIYAFSYDFSSNFSYQRVLVIDGATNSIIANIPVPNYGLSSEGLAINPNTNRIYLVKSGYPSASKSGILVVLDGQTNSASNIPISNGYPEDVGVNPLTNQIYVTTHYVDDTGKVISDMVVLDGQTNSVVTTIPLGTEIEAFNRPIAVNALTNRIYVPSYSNGNVMVIDGNTNSVVATTTVGYGSFDVAVNPTTNRIYITKTPTVDQDYNLVVLDGSTNSVVATTKTTAVEAGFVGVNPGTNLVYVSDNHAGRVLVLRERSTSSTSLTSSLNPSPAGQNVTFSAAITPITATGTVRFNFDNGTSGTADLSNGTATYVTNTLTFGSHSVTATYNGDTNLDSSTSSTLTQLIKAGSPAKIVPASSTGKSTITDTTFSSPLVAKVMDDFFNPVSSANITFTLPSNGPSATFAGGSTVYSGRTDSSGYVTTSLLTANALTGTYVVTATVAGVTMPAIFRLYNLSSNCVNGNQVTSTADDGGCGTLRQAAFAVSSSPTKIVSISLPAGSVISLTSGLSLSDGVAITTTASCGAITAGEPPIILSGNEINDGNGLELTTNSLYGVWVRGFSGVQILTSSTGHATLRCVRASKS